MSDSNELSHEEVKRILEIVDKATDIEVRVEINGLKLWVQKFSGETVGRVRSDIETEFTQKPPVVEAVPSTPSSGVKVEEAAGTHVPDEGTEVIYAPTPGRFFRAPSPEEPVYVEVGSVVAPDSPICLLEVMKVFSTIHARCTGTIKEILVSNEEMVEQGQPLFVIEITE